MGSYLVVNGIENNTKSISYPMIDLMRDVLTYKKSLRGEKVFALTAQEVAKVLDYSLILADNIDGSTESYIERHSDDYGYDEGLDEVKYTFDQISKILSASLVDIVIEDKDAIICKWV